MGRTDKPNDWMVTAPCSRSSPHLTRDIATKEEALVEMFKLCFRPSDNSIGRVIKMMHYCDISMKYMGKLPDDWHVFVRDTKDLPLT